jgi:serine protease AprX
LYKGFNLQHPSTKNLTILDQYDFVNGDAIVSNQPKDQSSSNNPEKHGTATLSACGGKDQGNLYGPAFGASFLLGKTEDLTKEDPIEEDNFANALEWGEKLGCDLVSASLGYQDWYDFSDKDGTDKLDIAIDKMVKLGVVVIVAAGASLFYIFYILFLK